MICQRGSSCFQVFQTEDRYIEPRTDERDQTEDHRGIAALGDLGIGLALGVVDEIRLLRTQLEA